MNNTEKILKEYADFMSSEEAPPAYLAAELSEKINPILFPSAWAVLCRLMAIVFVTGLLNLAICPQFGLGFISNSGLYQLFMQFGHYTCKAFCGALFIGSGFFLASLVLTAEDMKILRQYRFLQVCAVSALALSVFTAAGGSVYMAAATYWMAGAVIGGLFCLEAGYFLRKQTA